MTLTTSNQINIEQRCINVLKGINIVAFDSLANTNIIYSPRRIKVALKTGQGTQTSRMPYFWRECLFAKAALQKHYLQVAQRLAKLESKNILTIITKCSNLANSMKKCPSHKFIIQSTTLI